MDTWTAFVSGASHEYDEPVLVAPPCLPLQQDSNQGVPFSGPSQHIPASDIWLLCLNHSNNFYRWKSWGFWIALRSSNRLGFARNFSFHIVCGRCRSCQETFEFILSQAMMPGSNYLGLWVSNSERGVWVILASRAWIHHQSGQLFYVYVLQMVAVWIRHIYDFNCYCWR